MACAICGRKTKPRRKTCSKKCRYGLVSIRHKAAGTRPPPKTAEQLAAAAARMTGPGCPKWNGGRTTAGGGAYVMVKAPGDWPWPEMVGSRGYIREHRMVMAEHLGRALAQSEVVHHGPGGTRDNRIGNLTLYARNGDHCAEHWSEGLYADRWPQCVFGCGRQSKPLKGVHFQACARCRRLAGNRGDARVVARH